MMGYLKAGRRSINSVDRYLDTISAKEEKEVMAIVTFIQALAVMQAALSFGSVSARKIHLEGRESENLFSTSLPV